MADEYWSIVLQSRSEVIIIIIIMRIT